MFRVARGRAVLVFWTAVGVASVSAGVVSYAVQAWAARPLADSVALLVLGGLLVAYVQLIYPAVTWLSIGSEGFVLRTLPGRRHVVWARVANIKAVSALTPAGPGGNVGGVRVYDADGALILIVPDVFAAGRDEMAATMEAAWRAAAPTVPPM